MSKDCCIRRASCSTWTWRWPKMFQMEKEKRQSLQGVTSMLLYFCWAHEVDACWLVSFLTVLLFIHIIAFCPFEIVGIAFCLFEITNITHSHLTVEEGCVQDKLQCLGCKARLGYFNWAGMQCNCGAWINPAFQLHRSRLDECHL